MPSLGSGQIIIRILIVITIPLFILLLTFYLSGAASFSSQAEILNIDLSGPSTFVMTLGGAFAILVFFALVYSFLVRRNLYG